MPIQDLKKTYSIKVAWGLQFLGYLRTLNLKFQKATIKIGVFLTLPSWLSQFSWDSQLGRVRKTSILVVNVWNFKLRVLKYQWNFRQNATVIWNLAKPLIYICCKSQNIFNYCPFSYRPSSARLWYLVIHGLAKKLILFNWRQTF